MNEQNWYKQVQTRIEHLYAEVGHIRKILNDIARELDDRFAKLDKILEWFSSAASSQVELASRLENLEKKVNG